MADKTADITGLIRGDGHTINVTLPMDITGATVFFTVNSEADPASDSTAAIKKEVTTHTDAANGKTTIVLDPVDTESMEAGVYYYDFQVKAADGSISSIPKAKFKLESDITRRTT